MKKTLTFLTAASALAVVAGCSSDNPVTTYDSYAEVSAAAMDLGDANSFDGDGVFGDPNYGFDPAAATVRDDVEVVTGSASYDGFILGDLGGPNLAGELSLDVAFAGGDVTGSADNFHHETDGAFTGTLTLTGGSILYGLAGETDTLGGTLEGDLTNDGTVYDTAITLDGAFVGNDGTATAPDAVGGAATGLLDDGVTAPLILDGAFLATR